MLARSQNVSGAANNHFYHADGNGNVTALINTDQKVSARYLYDPYGNLLASSGGMAEANLYGFSSKEKHDASGLIHYGERYYDPSLQRFLNRDPIGVEGGINLYAALLNDPINAIDPWGQFTLIDVLTVQEIRHTVVTMLLPILLEFNPSNGGVFLPYIPREIWYGYFNPDQGSGIGSVVDKKRCRFLVLESF